ncbi:MAG: hypothetical protein Q7R52_01440 [archaeon]|nr:hypothetical protein [archaeon]
MKQQIYIIIASICLVLGTGFFIFNIQNSPTGFTISTGEVIFSDNQTKITEEMALQAISESEDVIKNMQNYNFSVYYLNDTLIEAKQVFQQVKYAEILKGEVDSTETEKQTAENALSLINWKNMTYSDVLVYTDDIKKRKDTAFLLYDKIIIEQNNLNGLSEQTKGIFLQAKTAFYEERYNDAEKLLSDFNNAVEKEKADVSTLSGIQIGAKNFFQRYWVYIIISLIVLGIAGYFTYKKFEKKLLRDKINRMRAEERAINELMKKTQTERFKENKISGLVYNIRMKKYEERLGEIKEELPVLEERLKYKKVKKGKR